SLCCGPMPTSLQRLSSCMNGILAILECPVCLDTIPPPAHQCGNGHLICVRCRLQSERCPVCRLRFTRGRSLLADKVYNSLTEAFHLREEPPETRSAKMRQRLVGKKKIPEVQRPVAEVKPTLNPPKNKLLTRIMGKSSSVENLSTNTKSSNSLSVDFASNLKTKSLSSSEIFNQISPAISQDSIISSNNVGVELSSSRSYQGSLESLTQRMLTDFGDTELTDDGALYSCPFSHNCTAQLKRPSLFRHLQHEHTGPLVQYFSPQFTTDIPPCLPDHSLITITTEGNVYFLKIIPKNQSDYFVWMWVLGGKFKAEALKLILTLRSSDVDSPELTFKSAVHSLANTSWSDVMNGDKGITLKKEIIEATFKNEKMKLQVGVTSKATQATAV
ncbi:hypothetical protein J6590_101578, partial [Homalodisca vitripennis]